MKKRWWLWVCLAVSAVALVLALLGIDLREAVESLAGARYVYLAPAGISLLAYLVVRSIRWWVMFEADVSFWRCFWVTNIGYLISNVFPFRLGDPARAVAIGVGSRVNGRAAVSAALSTVVVERVLDMLMVVLLLAITLPFVKQAGWMQGAGVVAGIAAMAALAAMVVVALWPDWIRRLARWCLERAKRLNAERWLGVLDGLLDGLSALRSPRRLVALLAWSVVTWVFVVGYYWAMLWAFLNHPPLVQGSFLTCAVGLGMAVPAAPGAMGVFESVARYALELPFGVLEEQAIAIAIASHAFQYVLSNLMGLIGLAQLGLSLGQLRADAAALESADDSEG
jgi:uncharacterized protein (TIRG00374 family)